ncbi:MAG: hypothetical protein U9Q69_03040 [Nanoarchaeota archaeon]|nr:hypothetical protein [Nanoarchaeota archaeon]
MIIKKVVLENIRSYINQEIAFPKGAVLLSGNIGAGKSSVLLAIEFALFGLRRSDLSGPSLLRKGENKGLIKLFFEVDGKQIEICRTLKKSASSVLQDAGYIIIDGIKKDGTAIELKHAVIDILNYPKELLTKTKSQIYRYTVYTPQESMKQILFCNEDERLETLRKVFGIDKYKRVARNVKIITNQLREKQKELQGMIMDLDEKIIAKTSQEKELSKIETESATLELPLIKILEKIKEAQQDIESIEKSIGDYNEWKSDLALLEQKILIKIERQKEIEKTIIINNCKLNGLKIENLHIDTEKLNNGLNDKKKMLNFLEERLIEARNKIQDAKTKMFNSETTTKTINEMDSCPLCLQEVSLRHKENIITKEGVSIKKLQILITEEIEKEKKIKEKIEIIKNNIEELRKQAHHLEVTAFKLKTAKELEMQLGNLEKEKLQIQTEIKNCQIKKGELSIKLESLEKIDEALHNAREQLAELQNTSEELKIKKAKLDTKLDGLKENLAKLIFEINKKNIKKNHLEYTNKIKYWLEEEFTNLMLSIEKQIMLKVHCDFEELFEKCFFLIMDKEELSVKLDESFTPIFTQNGYETNYQYLSGGEKTAVALAYRLSLNQVINNLMATIKTKDLIILDEPTDGFSNDQLDKLGLLFNELNMSQIIIVSHEQKIENFVENVIRFTKNEHISETSIY